MVLNNVTTRRQMQELKKGDAFYVNDKKYTASSDSHYSGDATYDGYIVFDENGDGWFEDDFPDD